MHEKPFWVEWVMCRCTWYRGMRVSKRLCEGCYVMRRYQDLVEGK